MRRAVQDLQGIPCQTHMYLGTAVSLTSAILFSRQQNGRDLTTEHQRDPRHHVECHLPAATGVGPAAVRPAMTME